MATGKITIGPEIGLIVETSTRIIIEEEVTTIEVVIETTDPNYRDSSRSQDRNN